MFWYINIKPRRGGTKLIVYVSPRRGSLLFLVTFLRSFAHGYKVPWTYGNATEPQLLTDYQFLYGGACNGGCTEEVDTGSEAAKIDSQCAGLTVGIDGADGLAKRVDELD